MTTAFSSAILKFSFTLSTFEVILSNPNGQIDDYTANNTMQSEFEYVG